jgi:TatD DNase family protein
MLIDSHCHLADEKFAPDLDEVVARARAAGVSRALCILSTDDGAEIERAAVVRAAWPEMLFAAAVHPHAAGSHAGRAPEAAAATRAVVAHVGAAAVGETGLDYHYDFAPRTAQQDVFAAQVELAISLDRPIVIHTREAVDDTLAILQQAGGGRARAVLHCFTGTAEEARRALDLGLYISLAGVVTFPRSDALRDLARLIPADRLLVETDAPYLAPVPYRGRRNEPAWVAETAAAIAAARGVDAPALAAETARNFEAFMAAPTAS